MKLNIKGFSVVEMAFAFVAVSVLIGVGWYVYQRQDNASTEEIAKITNFEECVATGSPVTETKPPECVADGEIFVDSSLTGEEAEAADWVLYESPKNRYSVRLPDGWTLYRYQNSEALYAFESEDIKRLDGVDATVVEEENGRDGGSVAFSLVVRSAANVDKARGKVKEKLTLGDHMVTLYSRTQAKEPDGIGPPKGTVTYEYRLKKGDKIAIISHDVQPDEKDQRTIIEQLIYTLKIN